MKLVEGRKDSFIKTPDGRTFPQMTFWSIMRMFSESDKIINFKVIQEKIDEIKIQIVPGRGFTQETINQLKIDIINVLGEDMHVETELVDEIPRKAGKMRSVVSKVKIDWDKQERGL